MAEHSADVVRILREVSTSVFITNRGTVVGPMPPHALLRLALKSDNEATQQIAADALAEQGSNSSNYSYYFDFAEGYLIRARLALARRNREEASRYWHEACRMLVAYGWHKDLTIFELLAPLQTLIKTDRVRSREPLV